MIANKYAPSSFSKALQGAHCFPNSSSRIAVIFSTRQSVVVNRAVSFLQLVNDSINQTLSRTILTAGPTLVACLALYFWGGEVLNGIAFALFTGIVVGTYSSIFVASALLVRWQRP